MKTLALTIATLLLPLHARAQGAELPDLMKNAPTMSEGVYGVGAGIGVGNPTGFNFALRTETLHTLSTLAGWNLSKGQFHVHGDYQVPFAELNPAESVLAVTFYAGLGATMDIDNSLGFGARVPVVAAISFDKPLEVFVEIAPVIGVLPDMDMRVQGTTGIRGWFRPKTSNGDGADVGGE
jgi:hypothetical protein